MSARSKLFLTSGVIVDTFTRSSQICAHFRQLSRQRPQPLFKLLIGATPLQCRHRSGNEIQRAAIIVQRRNRDGGGVSMSHSIGQQFFFILEQSVFIWVNKISGHQFTHLKPQEIDFAISDPLIAAEPDEAIIDVANVLTSRQQRGAIHRAIIVQCATLGRSHQQCLMRMLTVQIHQRATDLTELGHRHRQSIHVGTTAALTGHDPGQHGIHPVGIKPAVNTGLLGALADERRIGPAAKQEFNGSHQ